MTMASPVGRLAARLCSAVRHARRLRYRVPRPLGWLLEDPHRVLTLVWLVGVLVVGGARMAHADTIIVGPDLARGAPKTLFETYDFTSYKLTVKPDDAHSDWFGVSQGVLEVVGFVNNLILWACLGILYGALTLLEWFLNLTVYRDSAPQIDAATQMIATNVFWPLIAATVAVGAFIAYARWRGEGRGFVSDLGWVVAAGVLAVGFAAGPSSIMGTVDGARQDIASGVIAGSAQYASTADNPVGFPTPPIGGDPKAAGTRRLVDGVWNTFGATTWCFAEFHDLDICRVAGYHALADDKRWTEWMSTLNEGGNVPEFREYGDWVRGQDMTRTGYMLLLALITIPMGFMLLRLVVSGLVAVIGFLLMLVIGLVFLAFWPIPGWFRQMGTRYWVYTLGLQLQVLFITVVISGVMVVSAIITTQAGKYGFFIVALLNLGLFVAAAKARSWLEMLTTSGGAGSMGFATALLARSAARAVVGGVAGLAGAGLGLAGAGLRGAGQAVNRGPGWGNQPGATRSRWGTHTSTVPRMAGLDPGGPVQAAAWRVRQPGTEPALPGSRPALPPGSSGSGAVVVSGGARRGGPAPVRAQGTHRAGAASSRPEVVDGTVTSNVAASRAKTSARSRVWVDKKGSGLSSLDQTPAARRKDGAHQITTVPRRPRRPGRQGGVASE
ncbi:MAG: hypothetical protein ACRDRU_22785 [Pseudonocardiaceae bacterium]